MPSQGGRRWFNLALVLVPDIGKQRKRPRHGQQILRLNGVGQSDTEKGDFRTRLFAESDCPRQSCFDIALFAADKISQLSTCKMSKTLSSRLLKNVVANIFGNSTSIAIQLLTVPILLHSWGVPLYGTWLVLTAIPGYLAFTDLGFANVAGNEMTMLVARDNQSAARSVFQSAWVFISVVSIVVTILGCLAAWLLPFEGWFNLEAMGTQDVRMIASLLFVYVLLVLQYGLVFAAFRSTGDYAVGAMYYSSIRLFEACAVVAVAALGGRPLYAAIALVTVRSVMMLATVLKLVQARPWLWYGWEDAQRSIISKLAAPAVAFVAIPLATAMSLQGMVLVVGIILGPVAVVTFSALRTLSRVGLSFMGIVNNAVWPEITTAFGHGNILLVRRLHRISCQSVVWLMLPAVFALAVLGRLLVRFWTHGAVAFNGPLFYTLLGVVAVNSFWYTSSVVLLGASAHERMSLVVLAGSLGSVLLAWVLLQRVGLIGAGFALIVTDLLIAPYVLTQSLRLTGDTGRAFAKVLSHPPPMRSFFRLRTNRVGY
jgi:O-antigen/teichoic acid export membrane protein